MYRDQRTESAGLWGSLQTDWRSGCFLGAEGTGVPGGYGSEQWSQDLPSVGTPHRTSNSNWCRGKKLSPCFTSVLSVGAALVAQRIKRLPTMPEAQVRSLSGEDPWRRKWQPTPVLLPGEFPWTEELGGLQSMRSQRVRHDWESSLDFTFHVDSILKSHHSNDVRGAFTQSEACTGKTPSIFHHHNYLCMLSH